MYSTPHSDADVRPVLDLELTDLIKQVQRHIENLYNVSVLISFRETTDNHVGITYCLHLTNKLTLPFEDILIIVEG